MTPNVFSKIARIALVAAFVGCAMAEPIPVRHTEGTVHGFLTLSSLDGTVLAAGDLSQVAQPGRVTTTLAFRFKDGSVHEETVVYSQRRVFRLLSYHLVQKGSAFKQPVDLSVDGSTGQATVRYADKDGKEKTAAERLKVETDLADGMVPMLVKNLGKTLPIVTVSMVVATPKPRMVKLVITRDGEDSFSIGSLQKKAARYTIRVEIGGVSGMVAPLVGKQPPDTHMWILEGATPALLKSEGPLFEGGPIWRIELASPVWPKAKS
jgi:hypothetical protein